MIAAYNMVQLCVVKATMRLSNAITLYYDDKTNDHKTKKKMIMLCLLSKKTSFEFLNNIIIQLLFTCEHFEQLILSWSYNIQQFIARTVPTELILNFKYNKFSSFFRYI